MIELGQWQLPADLRSKTWLMLGKGPSFAHRHDVDLTQFATLSLNHVVLEQKVDVAHMLDWDVVQDTADALAEHCRYVLLPRHPNIDFGAALSTVEDLLRFVPALGDLAAQGRVVLYSRAGVDKGPVPLVEVQHFSAEAALDALGHLGVKTVRTLGVDGGTSYAADFTAVAAATRLANGQPSFSRQTARLKAIARRHRMEVRPLVDPLRIFVGADESQLLAAAVLEHTIRRFATRPVEVTLLTDVVTPLPRNPRNHPRTAFSFSRFHIPALCSFEGRALYLDADMQVFGDISALWDIEFDGAKVLCTNQPAETTPEQWRGSSHFHPGRQMSVMMLDCGALRWDVDEIVHGLDAEQYTYEQLMFEMCLLRPEEIRDGLPTEWNHLEHYESQETQLLHYTVVPTQPWKNDANPLRSLWEQAFELAWSEHAIDEALLRAQIRGRHVKRSLRRLARPLPDPTPRPATTAVELELRMTRSRLKSAERTVADRARTAARLIRSRLS
jgi:hypothetical protein